MLKTAFSLLVLIATTVVCFGQSASRAEMRGTTVNTLNTIADLINWAPEPSTVGTNMVFVKNHSGTNGLGGGLFELRGTNGFATNRGTIFASTAPRKFWFRVYSGPIDVTWFGAKHNAFDATPTDDTFAIQDAFNYLTNGARNATLFFPGGDYKVTTNLLIRGHEPGWGWRIFGELGNTRLPSGTTLWWYGFTNGATMLVLSNVNNSIIEGINLHGRGLINTAIRVDSSSTPGSAGIRFRDMTIAGYSGARSAAIRIGRASAVTDQVSELEFHRIYFAGNVSDGPGGTGSDYAVIAEQYGNTKNFAFYNTWHLYHTNAFNFTAGGNSLVRMQNTIGGYCQTGMVQGVSFVTIDGWYDEGSSNFVHQLSGGLNPGSMDINNVEWHGNAHAGNGDEIARFEAKVVIRNSLFENARTPASVPNIVITRSPQYSDGPGGLRSEHNCFVNATIAPYYSDDGAVGATSTNNWLFHSFDVSQNPLAYGNVANTNLTLSSEGDYGWQPGGFGISNFKTHDHGGGNRIVDYLHVLQTLVAYSNKVGIATLNPTNTLDVNGKTSLRSSVWMHSLPTNSSPPIYVAKLASGQLVDTAPPVGTGSGNFSTNSSGDAQFKGVVTITNETGNTASFERGVVLNSGQVRIRDHIGDNLGGSTYVWQWVENTNRVYLQRNATDLDFPLDYIRDLDIFKIGRTNGTTLVPGNLEVVGNATFGSFTTPRLIILSNTVEMTTGVAWTNADLMSGSRTFVFTNWLGGNKVFQITNIAGTTNSEIEGVFIADGSDRYVTNEFASIGGTIPILFHNMSGAAADPPFVLKVPANTKVEFNYKAHSEINGAITNFVKCLTNIISK